jgi:hypothetical protein
MERSAVSQVSQLQGASSMTSFEVSLLMGFLPIIYFLIYMQRNRILFGERITTTILSRRGRIVATSDTHYQIEFDDGSTAWYRIEMLSKD